MINLIVSLFSEIHYALIVPSLLSVSTFFINLITAVSDGKIDSIELHKLSASASGTQLIILVVVMVVLKFKGNKQSTQKNE